MEISESTRVGVAAYLMLVMGVPAPQAHQLLDELESSGLVKATTSGQVAIKL